MHRGQHPAGCRLLKPNRDPVACLLDAHATPVGEDGSRPKAIARSRIENSMQLSAMDPDLRISIAGAKAARLLVDQLTKAVEKSAVVILHTRGNQFAAQSKRRKLPHCVRQDRDTDAEFSEFGCRFEDTAENPALMQPDRECQPRDTSADNCDPAVRPEIHARNNASGLATFLGSPSKKARILSIARV